MTADEKRAREGHARMMLRRLMPTRRSKVWTLQTNGRGETDYVRLFVVKGGEIVEITYYVAAIAGRRMTPDGIAYGGGQYSKQLEAADDAWRSRFGAPLPQDPQRPLWERLGRAA